MMCCYDVFYSIFYLNLVSYLCVCVCTPWLIASVQQQQQQHWCHQYHHQWQQSFSLLVLVCLLFLCLNIAFTLLLVWLEGPLVCTPVPSTPPLVPFEDLVVELRLSWSNSGGSRLVQQEYSRSSVGSSSTVLFRWIIFNIFLCSQS